MIKVSVIIPVYNSEKYIEKAVLSVITQELKEIQVIIIDDGSTDKSVEICTELCNKYNNIELYVQENKGPGAARNLGLSYAKGEYITFLDSDDYIPEKVFGKIYTYLTKNKADIFVGNILCFNNVRKWHLPYMDRLFNKNNKLIIKKFSDIPEVNQSPSVCNKWFKNEIIRKKSILFNDKLKVGEDLLFVQECFMNSNLIALKNIDIYYYRLVNKESLIKKADLNFFYELMECNKRLNELYNNENMSNEFIIKRQLEFLVDSIFLKAKKMDKNDIISLINIAIEIFQLNKDMKIDKIDFRTLERYFLANLIRNRQVHEAIKFIENVILENCPKELIIKDNKHYSYLAGMFESYNELLQVDPIIQSKVENSYVENEKLIIRGYSFIKGLNIEKSSDIRRTLVLEGIKKGNIIRTKIENDYRTDLTYIFRQDKINYNWGGYKPITINLNDLIDDEYEVYMEINILGNIYRVPFEYRLAEIRNKLKTQYLQNNKEVFCRFLDLYYLKIRIKKLSRTQIIKSKLRRIKRNFRYDLSLIKRKKYKSFFVLYLYRIIGWYLIKKEIWLMGERQDTAQDNTYHLFKYIKENSNKINIKYVISKDSDDLEGIKKYGDIVWFNSIAHSLYLLTCKFTINSYAERPNMYTKEYIDIIKYYPEYKNNKKVFLQHGVIGVSRVNHVLHKNKVDYDLFVVSSEFEKQHLLKEFGYEDNEVIVTGLARWDNLHNNASKNKILLMPTWRSWIKSEEELLESEYFNKYIELIKDKKMHNILKENGYELTFYPHYQIQKLIEKMNINVPNYIKFVKQGENKVQDLINENYLLITDYSSVSYDFAYCNKPVIFYQFDHDDFFSKHYNKGPVKYKEDLFGIKCEEMTDILAILKNKEYIYNDNDKIVTYILRNKNHCEFILTKIYEL